MPVVGLVDSNGEHFTFEEVREGRGVFLTRRGDEAPRALLRALSKQYRSADHYGDPDVISVTTLINPIQQTRLLQRHDAYVDWQDNIWSTYGSLMHAILEAGAADGDIVEHQLVIERGGVKIGGTFDLLELTKRVSVQNVYQGRDYKVTSAYGVKSMVQAAEQDPLMGVYREKPDYFWQAQLYNLMTQDPDVKQVLPYKGDLPQAPRFELKPWPYAGNVSLDNWALTAITRDWNERQHGKYIGPVEVVNIPLLGLERVENYLAQRVGLYSASELCDDAGLPECTPEETWTGKRCAKYCAAAPVCHQIGNGGV